MKNFIIIISLLISLVDGQPQGNNDLQGRGDFEDYEIMTLFNGRIYQSENFNRYNHPFLGENTWVNGKIILDNYSFHDLALKYDIVCDHPIMNLTLYSSALAIQPGIERVQEFTLDSKRFIRLTGEHYSKCTPGFYELHLDGNYAVYCHYYKVNPKNIGSTERWPTKSEYFIGHENSFVKISRRSDLLKFFSKDAIALKKIDELGLPGKIKEIELLISLCQNLNE